MCHKGLKEMVGNLFKLLDASNMSSNYCLLFLVDSDSAKDLSVGELLVLEVPKSSRELTLVLLVEDDFSSGRTVIYLIYNAHLFFDSRDNSSHHNYLKTSKICLTSLTWWPSISREPSGVSGASIAIFKVTGTNT
jgi:hypothetical protein